MSIHRNDGNKTPYIVVVTGANGITAKLYEPSWQRAKERADEAVNSPFCANVHAFNAETGEFYRP